LAEGLKTGDQSTTSDIGQASDKNIAGGANAVAGAAANNAASNEDISPEGLLNVIS